MSDNDNIFRMIQGKQESKAPENEPVPVNPYIITDRNGNEYYHEGFMLFTSQHIAIMRETPQGALPLFVMPLDQVMFAEIGEVVEDDEEAEYDA